MTGEDMVKTEQDLNWFRLEKVIGEDIAEAGFQKM